MSRARAVHALDVLRDGELAGRIERTASGAAFTYDAAFLEAHAGDRRGIAVHLPLRREPIEQQGANLHPFFANLLPEGARLAALVAAVRSAKDDLLSYAAVVGADTVGDVSLVPPDAPPPDLTPTLDLSRAGELSFRELWEESTAYGRARGEAMTVPGVQEKISAAMISFPVRARARASAPAILKLEPPALPRLVANEHFFMRAARDAGLDVADTEVVRDRDGAPGLLVSRFDREVERGGRVRRIHQEDGCQLLDRFPADKYALSVDDLARGLSVCETPLLEVAALIRLTAYSYVIANGDLHAKNVSVLATRSGRLAMSPAYDLLSTLPYGDAKMALPIAGRDARLKRKHFVELGARHGVRARAVESMLDRVCDGIAPWIPRLDEIGLAPKKTAHLARTIAARRDDLGASDA